MALGYPHMYPIRGMIYVAYNPHKWPGILWSFLITGAFAIMITLILFVFAFPAQAKGLSTLMSSWTAWTVAFFLTTFEVSISILIFTALHQAYRMRHTYDALWYEETFGISREEALKVESPAIPYKRTFLMLILIRVVLVIVTAPLNLIPCFGMILYISLNGYIYAWSLHCRYFDLIGLTFVQGRQYVKRNHAEYAQFGFVALLLEMVPLLNFVTPTTNLVGSVLWASDIERFKDPLERPRNCLFEQTHDGWTGEGKSPALNYQQSSSIPEKQYSLATVW